jgi:hypothetical protein
MKDAKMGGHPDAQTFLSIQELVSLTQPKVLTALAGTHIREVATTKSLPPHPNQLLTRAQKVTS